VLETSKVSPGISSLELLQGKNALSSSYVLTVELSGPGHRQRVRRIAISAFGVRKSIVEGDSEPANADHALR
jgi:hypothetical protein